MTWIAAITVEGLGKGSVNKRYRYATMIPAWDTDGVYTDDLKALPPEISTQVDFAAGRPELGGLVFELLHSIRTGIDFWTSRPVAVGEADTALLTVAPGTAGTLSTDVTDGSLANRLVYWGREAIYVGSHIGGGDYNCIRGVLGTAAPSHAISAGYNRSLRAGITDDILDRQVQLIIVPFENGSYADEVELDVYVVQGIDSSGGLIRVTCDISLGLLENVKICEELWKGRIEATSRYGLDFRGPGSPNAASGALTLSVDAKGGYQLVSYTTDSADSTSLSPSSGIPLPLNASARLDTVEPKYAAVWEFYRCTGVDGAEDTLPLQRNIISLTLQLLTTGARGDNYDSAGGATNYDVGVADLGAGIDYRLIDIAGIEAIRGELGSDAYFDRNQLGFDGKPVRLLEWIIERVCKPFGLALTVGPGGQITLAMLRDDARPGDTINRLREGDGWEVLSGPEDTSQMRRLTDPADSVVCEWDEVVGVGTRSDRFIDINAQERRIRTRSSSRTLQLHGLGPAQEPLMQQLATHYVHTWRVAFDEVILQADRVAGLYTTNSALLTHSKVHTGDGGGGIGVTSLLCHVTGRRLSLEEGIVEQRLIQVGKVFTGQRGWVAPSAKVESYDAGTKTITLYPGTFQSGLTYYTTDSAALDADGEHTTPKFDHCARDHSVHTPAREIVSLTGNDLVHSGAILSPAPTDGDLIKMANYAEATTEQRDAWAAMADNTATPPTVDGDSAYEWGR